MGIPPYSRPFFMPTGENMELIIMGLVIFILILKGEIDARINRKIITDLQDRIQAGSLQDYKELTSDIPKKEPSINDAMDILAEQELLEEEDVV